MLRVNCGNVFTDDRLYLIAVVVAGRVIAVAVVLRASKEEETVEASLEEALLTNIGDMERREGGRGR